MTAITTQANGCADHRLIMRGDEQIGQALRMANGKWGAFGMDDKGLTVERFKNPKAVAAWFAANRPTPGEHHDH